MSPDVNNPAFRALSYDELADAYREQMEALLEGGVDALLGVREVNSSATLRARRTAARFISRT